MSSKCTSNAHDSQLVKCATKVLQCTFIKSRTVCRSSNCTFRTSENVVRCPDIRFSRGVTTTTTTYLNRVRRTERIALCVRRSQRISEQLVLAMLCYPLLQNTLRAKHFGEPREKEKGREIGSGDWQFL